MARLSRCSTSWIIIACILAILAIFLACYQLFFVLSSSAQSAQTTKGTTDRTNGPPFYDWNKTKTWICPNRTPNLTAAAIIFRLAQQIGLDSFDEYGHNNNLITSSANKNSQTTRIPMNIITTPMSTIEKFFSHWPGHVSIREKTTNKTATFLRTYKCGSKTVRAYFENQLQKTDEFDDCQTSLKWHDFEKQQLYRGAGSTTTLLSSCICTVFRDPMDHFFSGLQEMEARRQNGRRNGKLKEFNLAPYEKLDLLSKERLIAFIDFVLQGGWEKAFQYPFILYFAHVLPQSGYLAVLSRVNQTISAFVNLNDVANSTPRVLHEACGLPKETLPPLVKRMGHAKVHGMSDLHRVLWNHGSSEVGQTDPRLLRKFEALCLLHAMDYACLDAELENPPPGICAETFRKYL